MVAIDTNAQSVETVFQNVSSIKRIAFDIGQTVVKIAYTSTVPNLKTTSKGELVLDSKQSLYLHCIQVRRENFDGVLDYLAENGKISARKASFSSYSAEDELERVIATRLNLEMHQIKEMDCLVRGTNFLMRNIEAESFVYDHHNQSCRYLFETIRPSAICPYLLVNVGTGISVFRVDSDESYERVGGSSLGGGTFFGLTHLLTNQLDLDQMMKMAEDGDHRQFDILVSDIYGGKYKSLGLTDDLIAGSFAKCTKREYVEDLKHTPHFKQNFVRSLLLMIANSIGQFAYLYAEQQKTNRIYFDGFLIRNHSIIMRTINYAIDFWSGGTQEAHFIRHEGYTAAVGAYLKGAQMMEEHCEYGSGSETERYSWKEYFSGCSELGRFVPTAPLSMGFTAGVLELECTDIVLRRFPLLADSDYLPDEIDLNQDEAAREFWLTTMEQSVDKVKIKAVESQSNSARAQERADEFARRYYQQVKLIREKPYAYGNTNVRNLLDLREQILNEMGFDDSYLAQKTAENREAMQQLPDVLHALDKITNNDERLFHVSRGLLAGNVFDWGAKKVVELMEEHGGLLPFEKAVETIPARPWLIDGFDGFLKAVKEKPYKCAAVFVDNCGADYILGVIPFTRELLSRGTKVIIVSNLSPALNDLTFHEMVDLIPQLEDCDPILSEAIQDNRLMFQHSGQGSPCLDLRKVHSVLTRAVLDHEVDLVVIEGMGRALHTNLSARFKCDSLKAAVIKTQWLADRMGGELFSVVFKFEKGTGIRGNRDFMERASICDAYEVEVKRKGQMAKTLEKIESAAALELSTSYF